MTKQRQQIGAICTWVVKDQAGRYVLATGALAQWTTWTPDLGVAHLWLDHDEALEYAARGFGYRDLGGDA